MGLFNRKNARNDAGSDSGSSEQKKEKGGWKRPANTAFKQQRLKAWQPILTPKTVLPTFFILGIIFAPIGAALIWGSGQVTEITVDYTNCEDQSPVANFNDAAAFKPVSSFSYRLQSGKDSSHNTPTFAFVQNSVAGQGPGQCAIRLDIPYDLSASVLVYYKLSNFYQNHRRYVKSLNSDQLKGQAKTADDLREGDCKPIAVRKVDDTDLPIYPCGLIANSVFNDTINVKWSAVNAGQDYTFSEKGIAWPGERKKYKDETHDYSADWSKVVPPPNWVAKYGERYNSTSFPKLAEDEHFQNWMRTAGLPTFTKLYGRNDNDVLKKGTYQVVIDLRFPVKPYNGHKSLVLSTVSWIGGKNPFLGWAYVGAAALFFLLGILGTIRHLVKPRKLGDMSLLSWNR